MTTSRHIASPLPKELLQSSSPLLSNFATNASSAAPPVLLVSGPPPKSTVDMNVPTITMLSSSRSTATLPLSKP